MDLPDSTTANPIEVRLAWIQFWFSGQVDDAQLIDPQTEGDLRLRWARLFFIDQDSRQAA